MVLSLQVSRLRLLGDNVHSTRIAFVEFAMVSLCFTNEELFYGITTDACLFYAFLV